MSYRTSSLIVLALVSPLACGTETSAPSVPSQDAAAPSASDAATDPSTEPSTEPSTPETDAAATSTAPEPDAGGTGTTDVTSPPAEAGVTEDSGAPTADAGDAPGDAGSSPDPTTDAGDAAPQPHTDAGQDSDAGGEPTDDPWLACPSADDYMGDVTSPLTLQVTEAATYCATFQETRTLKEEFAAKAQLRFTPGAYPLPDQASTDLVWPVCMRQGETAAVAASSGSSDYVMNGFEDSVTHTVTAAQRFESLGELRLRVERTVTDGSSPGFVLDGTEVPMDTFDEYHSLEFCSEPGADCFPDRIFDSCEHSSGVLNRHEVALDSGNVVFELRLGDSFAGTEPGAYVRASGTFRGHDFEQLDYFRLIYHPSHHHFERTFAVLFAEPLDGVCGIEVHALEPFGDDVPDQAFTVDCELNRLEELSVEDHTLVRDE